MIVRIAEATSDPDCKHVGEAQENAAEAEVESTARPSHICECETPVFSRKPVDIYGLHDNQRGDVRKWAIRCGYCLAIVWALGLVIFVAAVSLHIV